MKWQKKGIVGILANPFILIALVILIAIIAFNVPSGKFLSIFSSISFAGRGWNVEVSDARIQSNGYPCSPGSASYTFEGETLVMSGSASGSQSQGCVGPGRVVATTDITNDDEVMVLFDGYGTASAGGSSASGSYSLITSVIDVNGIELSQAKEVAASSRGVTSASASFEPQIFSFKNNFDGTWSSIQSFGIGDVFIKKETMVMTPPIKLRLISEASVGLSDGSASANGISRFYNVVFKENGFAVCKADEVLVDKVCQTLSSILLKNEEAIKESFDEKLARIEAELLAKNQGLTEDLTKLQAQLEQQGITQHEIDLLKVQIAILENELKTDPNNQLLQNQLDELKSQDLAGKIASLQSELDGAKQQLADVQAGDKTVVNVIEANEKIQEPNIIKRFFNRLIAWMQNLFA
ncbi:MAG: hypothetical protein UU72_C0053G0006 [candidate division WWE3 bacterium GW2011_GWB1_41_6]|uniref:Uncharacterized protein n=1 Tax=candidate division WWE3 bacterium GW2011_GWB1_41_6 TaxID=1619112 RepID=A0A0G0WQ09_UNCKA|nr:MAG: hypothetical protein UU72_C0053G0006 [candidate division WWE3 bacterium GW2011_GWB1_41_6]